MSLTETQRTTTLAGRGLFLLLQSRIEILAQGLAGLLDSFLFYRCIDVCAFQQ